MVDGKEEIYRIPEGTQTGTKFVIKNKGFKSVNGNWNGDYVFTVIVQTPKKTNSRTKRIIKSISKNYERATTSKEKRNIWIKNIKIRAINFALIFV